MWLLKVTGDCPRSHVAVGWNESEAFVIHSSAAAWRLLGHPVPRYDHQQQAILTGTRSSRTRTDGDLAFNDSEWTNDRMCENKDGVKDSKFKAEDSN